MYQLFYSGRSRALGFLVHGQSDTEVPRDWLRGDTALGRDPCSVLEELGMSSIRGGFTSALKIIPLRHALFGETGHSQVGKGPSAQLWVR